jgi:hypothetical protein
LISYTVVAAAIIHTTTTLFVSFALPVQVYQLLMGVLVVLVKPAGHPRQRHQQRPLFDELNHHEFTGSCPALR